MTEFKWLPPITVTAAARQAIWEIDSNLPVERVMTMEQAIAQVDTQNTFFMRVLSGLSVIALVLAGVGIYGVISYSVHQRSQELGIRMAMGARPGKILSLVVKQGAILTGIGLAMVGAYKGYRVKLALPACVSVERRQTLLAYGAELVLTPAHERTDGAIRAAHRMCSFFVQHPSILHLVPARGKRIAHWAKTWICDKRWLRAWKPRRRGDGVR